MEIGSEYMSNLKENEGGLNMSDSGIYNYSTSNDDRTEKKLYLAIPIVVIVALNLVIAFLSN